VPLSDGSDQSRRTGTDIPAARSTGVRSGWQLAKKADIRKWWPIERGQHKRRTTAKALLPDGSLFQTDHLFHLRQ
jgi:hypothetical protein